MNEKFTPGPWNKKEINICSQHKAGLSLAFLTTSDWRKQEEGEANAHLIVTAPEVYEIITALLEYIDAIPPEVVASLPTMPGVSRDWIESVMAKARGES